MAGPQASTPVSFSDLPGWAGVDPMPAIEALKRSCATWSSRSPTAPISARVGYGGRVEDWSPACAALEVAQNAASARIIFEALFVPVVVAGDGSEGRFTGYYEPEIEARRLPSPPFTEAVPGVPADLVQTDASRFGREGGLAPAQRLPDGRLRPYPPRSAIRPDPARALGYAHPADVFFLMFQGSGRLRVPVGRAVRAAYAAHNGHPFRSTANWLIRNGEIPPSNAGMAGIRAWMDQASPRRLREALNANPRFVFFQEKPIGDPELGPEGALSVPLTPLGSMAVDPSLHPLGIPFFVETRAPGLGGDWSGVLVAQDTGGAIQGRVRGDIYFGTGAAAGGRAGTVNAAGRMWALLPKHLVRDPAPSPAVAANDHVQTAADPR